MMDLKSLTKVPTMLLFLICAILSSVSVSPTSLLPSGDPADVLDPPFEGASLALRAVQDSGSWPLVPPVYLNCSRPLFKDVPLRHCAPPGPGQPDGWLRDAITLERCSSYCHCEHVLSAVVFFCPKIGNCSNRVSESTCRNAGYCNCCPKNSTAAEYSTFQGNVSCRSDIKARSNNIFHPVAIEEHEALAEREPTVDTSDILGYDRSTSVNGSLTTTCTPHSPKNSSVLRKCPAGPLTRAYCVDKCFCYRLKPHREALFPIVMCPAVLGCNGPEVMEACANDGHCRCHFRDSTAQTREIGETISLEDVSIAEQLDPRTDDLLFRYSIKCDGTAKHTGSKLKYCGPKKVLDRTTCQSDCRCTDEGVLECPKFDKCNATVVTKACGRPGRCECFPIHEPPPPGVAVRAVLDPA